MRLLRELTPEGRESKKGRGPSDPTRMEGLLEFARKQGLNSEQALRVLRLHRPSSDTGWVDAADVGSEALVIAKETMEAGRYLEYCCYESTGAPQGRAVLKLLDWEDDGVLVAEHCECSDPYYQWYADHDIKERGAVYHICQGKHSTCRFKLPRGDRRIMIHLDRWRLLTPATMVQTDYLREKGNTWARVLLKDAAEAKARQAGAPEAAPGTGIERALAEAGVEAGFPPIAPEPAGRGDEERPDKTPMEDTKKIEDHIREQVARHEKRARSRSPAKKRRNKDKSAKEKGRRRRKDTSEYSSASSGSSLFRPAPARGGELWRQAQKKPGRLTQRSLDEMCRYMADRSDTGGGSDLAWSGQKVVAYLNQVVLVNHPPARIGVRSHREMVTLGMAIDEILSGRLMHALDLLVQRFKAIEASFEEGGWATARHLEIIPGGGAGMMREDERAAAAKAEIQA